MSLPFSCLRKGLIQRRGIGLVSGRAAKPTSRYLSLPGSLSLAGQGVAAAEPGGPGSMLGCLSEGSTGVKINELVFPKEHCRVRTRVQILLEDSEILTWETWPGGGAGERLQRPEEEEESLFQPDLV